MNMSGTALFEGRGAVRLRSVFGVHLIFASRLDARCCSRC